MFSILVLAKASKAINELRSELIKNSFACTIGNIGDEAIETIAEQSPDLVLVEADNQASISELIQKVKQERPLPVIALVSMAALANFNGHQDADDFAVEPYNARELVVRVKRLIRKTSNLDSNEQIVYGDMVIDLARCEVSVAGRRVMLTFKEYELLRFLAGNEGRVFARDALLNKVWGYDYFGGDRTVDVHIRRLRSKIEDASHTFIETVRNIGYRFREQV